MAAHSAKGSTASEVAASALGAATHALGVCASALDALDARVAGLERALEARTAPGAPASLMALALEFAGHGGYAYVDTDTAARWLGIPPQTLRGWARRGKAPLTPLRHQRRLVWPVAELQALRAATAG